MCILPDVTLFCCSGVPQMYCQLGGCLMSLCAFFYMWYWLQGGQWERERDCICQSNMMWDSIFLHTRCNVVVLQWCMLNWWGVHLPFIYMCIVLCVKLIWCNGVMWNLFGVMVLHTPMVNWPGGSVCHQYICAFSYMWNLYGVMVLHAAMVNWMGGPSAISIYVHAPICETYLV